MSRLLQGSRFIFLLGGGEKKERGTEKVRNWRPGSLEPGKSVGGPTLGARVGRRVGGGNRGSGGKGGGGEWEGTVGGTEVSGGTRETLRETSRAI